MTGLRTGWGEGPETWRRRPVSPFRGCRGSIAAQTWKNTRVDWAGRSPLLVARPLAASSNTLVASSKALSY